VLVLWQSVPIATYQDDAGRTRVGFGFGFGQFESVSVTWGMSDCYGEPTPIERTAHKSSVRAAGADIETWVRPDMRVHGFAGGIVSDTLGWTGAMAGGMISLEKPRWGAGLGAALVPPTTERAGGVDVLPSFQLRAGGLDGLHGRIDFAPPAPVFGMTGLMRLGAGYNQGTRGGVGGFGGIAVCQYCVGSDDEEAEVAGFLELAVPITRRFDLDTRVLYGRGQHFPVWGVALGARAYLGGPRSGVTP
jgi:hypothetical protein